MSSRFVRIDDSLVNVDDISVVIERGKNSAICMRGDYEGVGMIPTNKNLDELLDILNDREPSYDWIPCRERLPEDSDYHDLWETPDGAVLWCKATGEIGIGWYYESTKNWCDLWDNGVKDVIAWMPLPDPYKGES